MPVNGKWCPFAFMATPGGQANRGMEGEMPAACQCITTDCQMWDAGAEDCARKQDLRAPTFQTILEGIQAGVEAWNGSGDPV